MPQPNYSSTPQREELARSRGFSSYEAMMLFEGQRTRQREALQRGKAGQPVIRGATPPVQPSPKAQEIMSWHPAVIFNRIAQVLGMGNDPEKK